MTDLLTTMLTKLDEKAPTFSRLDTYMNGTQPLTFLAPEARKALGNRLSTVSVNIPRLLVDALTERLRVTGFGGVDVWDEWLRNDLDLASMVAHREALALGSSFCTVWADRAGRPNVSVESARQMVMQTDPGTRETLRALKRWEDTKGTHCVLYEPDRIVRYRSQNPGATTLGFEVVETLRNPLGQVPVVRFRNGSRLLDDGRSEMADVLGLTDALVKLTSDMLISSEYTARPRRWASGIELEEAPVLDDNGDPTGETETINPIPEGDRAMVSENEGAKFGQLAGSDLSGYENALGVIMRQISAVSGLPEHMLGIGGDNPTSADSIRASEAALTAKAEARQAQFGREWSKVAALIVAVRDGVDPASVQPRVQWADPSTRSIAQEADATVKLVQAGVLPVSFALKRLGYSESEITEIRTARAVDGFNPSAVTL